MTKTLLPRLQHVLTVTLDGLTDEQKLRVIEGTRRLLADVEAPPPVRTTDVLGWTLAALELALSRLERESGWVQAGCIRWALTHGGVIGRDDVYRIGNYHQNRMLRGWTRPVNRVVSAMRASGEIPASAADLVEPIYGNDVKADGFRVPPELAALATSA